MHMRIQHWAGVAAYLVGAVIAAAQGTHDLVSRLTGNPGYSFHASPADWRDVNMYQLFTDRFFDGNSGNNLARSSTAGSPWYNVTGSNAETNRHFFQGGDWAGVKAKLDYLQGMGVNCIWISGVQMNEQGNDKRFTPYHAYHPSDFYKVEPMFGTFAELKDLIDTCHGRGMYVILDVVVNHMADLMKYTDCNCNYEGYCENNCAGLGYWNNAVQFGAPFNGPQWFHNNGNIGDSDWDTYPRYIKGAFLGTEDLKTEDPTVQNELRNIFKHLIDATDCDGFRVDAIKHMDYTFIKEWADSMRVHAAGRGKSNFLLFGEYFSYDDATQASYCKDVGFSFNSTLWFPMQQTLKNVFAYEQGTGQLASRMNALSQYGEAADKVVAFLDNHDVDRIALECGSTWESKLRPALTFLYTCPPVPCLFYGTEHGFDQGGRRNGSPKLGQADFQRECMMNYGFQWGNAFGDKFFASPLYNHIKKLNELRAQYECLRRGTYAERWQEGGAGLFAYTRTTGSQDALVVINTSSGSKSCNPQVAKPDGTVYENKLNPGETLTVSGGRLSLSINGKDSKIFVAGLGQAQVGNTCNATNLIITYRPNSGPLATPTGAIHLLASHDGGQHPADTVMTLATGVWSGTYSLTNHATNVTFTFRDEAVAPHVDNNSGAGWSVDVRGCGLPPVDLAWIGNTYHWPPGTNWDVGEDLWVNIESWPQNAVINGEVVYSPDGGANWTSTPLGFNGVNGNNDTWHANLGAHPAGTNVKYAVRLTGRNGDLWANNGGTNYSARVNAGPTVIQWIGDTRHWPDNGSIEPLAEIWVDIASQPVGAGRTGEVVFSSDGGATWQTRGLSANGTGNDKDLWHANLGGFNPEATVRYAVKVVDGNGTAFWDNNSGSNYVAVINPAPSTLRWFGNSIHAGAPPPALRIRPGSGPLVLDLEDLRSNGLYGVLRSTNLTDWAPAASHEATAPTGDVAVAAETNATVFYRVVPDWVPAGPVFNDEEVAISVETWPAGGATAATLVFSTDGGSNWQTRAMRRSGPRNNNDIWTAVLGMYPPGTVIRYAIELKDAADDSHWDNNQQQDYQLTVRDPNVADFSPPTASHSPLATTTTNATLDLVLSAVDDLDPAPAIHFTTNGSAPTAGSPVYASPIHVVDAGGGVDLTVKYFARDASGNASGIATVEVKVSHGFAFGGGKPYSVNPTLGKRVANGGITVDGANSGEWTTNNAIALDMANDDPRSLGSNWTMHEAPIDLTHVWAAWDDTYLYLAWQYVDVTDILDPANAGGAGSGKISSNDGILQWLVLDTVPGAAGATNDVWNKKNSWAGVDKPDYQIYLAGSLWQGYISRATNNVFPVDDGGVNYKTVAAAGITAAKGSLCAAAQLWGVGDADSRFAGGAPDRNFLAEGHSGTRDSFYEMRVPLAYLGLTAAQLESTGIGVMVGAGSASAMDCAPNDPATLDTPGVEVWNSSFEWADTDRFTVPFARIGAGK